MIECVWIEIRPALRCCHICVVFKEDITSGVRLKLRKSNFLLEVNGKDFEVKFQNFTLEPLTMTGFKAVGRYLSFRIQAECKVKCQTIARPELSPPVPAKRKTSLVCNCHNPMTGEVTFERVLPLPSNEFNPSDLFCHLSHGPQPSTSLTPKPTDCLYSDHYILISSDLVTGCLKRGKFLKCKRCLSTVGVNDTNGIKLWTCSLKLSCDTSTPVEQFKYLVRKAVHDPFSLFPKLLLECQESNCYLYVIVVDKNLIVSTCEGNLEMKNLQVVKLKYGFHSSCDAQVKSVMDDNAVHHIQILKFMMDAIVQFLTSNSKNIPPLFSKIDDECMTYLCLCD